MTRRALELNGVKEIKLICGQFDARVRNQSELATRLNTQLTKVNTTICYELVFTPTKIENTGW